MLNIKKEDNLDENIVKLNPKILEKLGVSNEEIIKIKNSSEFLLVKAVSDLNVDKNKIEISSTVAEKINFAEEEKVSIKEEKDSKILEKLQEEPDSDESLGVKPGEINFEDVFGLEPEKKILKETLETYKKKDLLEENNFKPIEGIIIDGNKGSQIQELSQACLSYLEEDGLQVNFNRIRDSKTKPDKKLKQIINNSEQKTDFLILNNLKTWDSRESWKASIQSTIEDTDLFLIITTHQPNVIEDYRLIENRFRHISISNLNKSNRAKVIKSSLPQELHEEKLIDKLSNETQGYSFKEIKTICRETYIYYINNKDLNLKKVANKALSKIIPSNMNQVNIISSSKKMKDVGGLEEEKEKINTAIRWPLEKKSLVDEYEITSSPGILLYGPPGTGKTLLVKAIAGSIGIPVISVNCQDIINKYYGESEKEINKIFKIAKENSPSIIYFDEFEALVPKRNMSSNSELTDRVVSQLLAEIDGVSNLEDVAIIASTNRPDIIDPALTRTGRIGEKVKIDIPNKESRKEIFEIHLQNKPHGDDININKLAEKTENYTGSDIEKICQNAARKRIGQRIKNQTDQQKITMDDLEKAINEQLPSYNSEIEKIYDQYEKGIDDIQKEEKYFQ